jgi:hypothetical protein
MQYIQVGILSLPPPPVKASKKDEILGSYTVDFHPISQNNFASTQTLSLGLGLFFLSGPLCPATGAI